MSRYIPHCGIELPYRYPIDSRYLPKRQLHLHWHHFSKFCWLISLLISSSACDCHVPDIAPWAWSALGLSAILDFHGLSSLDSASHYQGFLSPIYDNDLDGLSKLFPRTWDEWYYGFASCELPTGVSQLTAFLYYFLPFELSLIQSISRLWILFPLL